MPRITARDGQGHQAAIVIGNEGDGLSTVPFALSVPFSNFPTVDFSNIQSIDIDVSRYGGGINRAGQSFALDSIVTAPEPARGWLLLSAATTTVAIFGRHVRWISVSG